MSNNKLNYIVKDIQKFKCIYDYYYKNDNKLSDLEFKLKKIPEYGLEQSNYEIINKTLCNTSRAFKYNYKFFEPLDLLIAFCDSRMEVYQLVHNCAKDYEALSVKELPIKNVFISLNDNPSIDCPYFLLVQSSLNTITAFTIKVKERNIEITYYIEFTIDIEDLIVFGSEMQVIIDGFNQIHHFSWKNIKNLMNGQLYPSFKQIYRKIKTNVTTVFGYYPETLRENLCFKADYSRKTLVILAIDSKTKEQYLEFFRVENREIIKLSELKLSILLDSVISKGDIFIEKEKVEIFDYIIIDKNEHKEVDLLIILSNIIKVYLKQSSTKAWEIVSISKMNTIGEVKYVKYLWAEFKNQTLHMLLTQHDIRDNEYTYVMYSEKFDELNHFPSVFMVKDVDSIIKQANINMVINKIKISDYNEDEDCKLFSKYNQIVSQNGNVHYLKSFELRSLLFNYEYYTEQTSSWQEDREFYNECGNSKNGLRGLNYFIFINKNKVSLVYESNEYFRINKTLINNLGIKSLDNVNSKSIIDTLRLYNPHLNSVNPNNLEFIIALLEQCLYNNITYFLYSDTKETNDERRNNLITEIRSYLYKEVFTQELTSSPIIMQISEKFNQYSYNVEDLIFNNFGKVQMSVSVFYIVYTRVMKNIQHLKIIIKQNSPYLYSPYKDNQYKYKLLRRNKYILSNLMDEIKSYGLYYFSESENIFNLDSVTITSTDIKNDIQGCTYQYLFYLYHTINKTINIINLGCLLEQISDLNLSLSNKEYSILDLVYSNDTYFNDEIDRIYVNASSINNLKKWWIVRVLSRIFDNYTIKINDDGNEVGIEEYMEENCFYFCKMQSVYMKKARGLIKKLKQNSIENKIIKELFYYVRLAIEYDSLNVNLSEFIAAYIANYKNIGITDWSLFKLIKLRCLDIAQNLKRSYDEDNEIFWTKMNEYTQKHILIYYDLVFEVLNELLKDKNKNFKDKRLFKSISPILNLESLNILPKHEIKRMILDSLSYMLPFDKEVSGYKMINEALYFSCYNILAKYPLLFKTFIGLLHNNAFSSSLYMFEDWGAHQTQHNVKFDGYIDYLFNVKYDFEKGMDLAYLRVFAPNSEDDTIANLSKSHKIITLDERIKFAKYFYSLADHFIQINRSIDSDLLMKIKNTLINQAIFDIIARSLESMEKNKIYNHDQAKEVNAYLMQKYSFSEFYTICKETEKFFAFILLLHLHLYNTDQFKLSQDEVEPLMEEYVGISEFLSSSKKNMVHKIYDGLRNIKNNLIQYWNAQMNSDMAARNTMSLTINACDEATDCLVYNFYIALFRRNYIDDGYIDHFYINLNLKYSDQIQFICKLKEEIEPQLENYDLYYKFLMAFIAVVSKLIVKLTRKLQRSAKVQPIYSTHNISYNRGYDKLNQNKGQEELDVNTLKLKMRPLKDVVDWMENQTIKLDIKLVTESEILGYKVIQDFLRDVFK